MLIDKEKRLVITTTESVPEGGSVRAHFWSPALNEDSESSKAASERPSLISINGRERFRNAQRGLLLLEMKSIPLEAAAPVLGDEAPAKGQTLYGLRSSENTEPLWQSWKCQDGAIGRVLMSPHFCSLGLPLTPWMVVMQPQQLFCDPGAPVVNDQGELVAIGAPRCPSDGDFLTRLIDVRAIRSTLQSVALNNHVE